MPAQITVGTLAALAPRHEVVGLLRACDFIGASTKPPHPEEHREAMRLEGWAAVSVPIAHARTGYCAHSRRSLRPLLSMRFLGLLRQARAIKSQALRRGRRPRLEAWAT